MYLTQPLRGPHANCMDPNVQKGLLTLQLNHSGIASSHCIYKYIMPHDQKFHQPDCLCKIYSGQHYEKTSKRHDWPLSQANSPSHNRSRRVHRNINVVRFSNGSSPLLEISTTVARNINGPLIKISTV